jgi:dTDP-4-amino-4,6-dideoxygalactose transaminase
MIPRGVPDIGYNDLLAGVAACLWPHPHWQVQQAAEARWSSTADTLASLSVRSAFDAILQALALPPGSEVLVSALTIPDMVRILLHHGLQPVPIDIDPETLALDCGQVQRAIRPHTRAVLVAHLFGSRMALDETAAIAQRHQLLLWEDCAQAYAGPTYRGHPASDISLFSFGPIKTHTALGGAFTCFRDPQLHAQVRAIQAKYPLQARSAYLRRILKLGGLSLLTPPPVYGAAVALLRRRGLNHDDLFSQIARSFPGANLIARIRYQPSASLLQMLERRVRNWDAQTIRRRIEMAQRIFAVIPQQPRPGRLADQHSHWVIPIFSQDPDALVQALWSAGFDATRKASSLTIVPSPPGWRTPMAEQIQARLLYLPFYPDLTDAQIAHMGLVINTSPR